MVKDELEVRKERLLVGRIARVLLLVRVRAGARCLLGVAKHVDTAKGVAPRAERVTTVSVRVTVRGARRRRAAPAAKDREKVEAGLARSHELLRRQPVDAVDDLRLLLRPLAVLDLLEHADGVDDRLVRAEGAVDPPLVPREAERAQLAHRRVEVVEHRPGRRQRVGGGQGLEAHDDALERPDGHADEPRLLRLRWRIAAAGRAAAVEAAAVEAAVMRPAGRAQHAARPSGRRHLDDDCLGDGRREARRLGKLHEQDAQRVRDQFGLRAARLGGGADERTHQFL